MNGTWQCSQCGGVNSLDSFQCKCGALNYGGGEQYEAIGSLGSNPAKKAKVEEPAASFDPFPQALVGRTFEVQGVNSKPELNGTRGIVRDYDFASQRYTIEIAGKGSFKLNRDNLRDPTTPQASGSGQAPLVGRVVEVQGLVAKPELNGQRGVAKEFDAAAGRYTIELEGGRGQFKLKPDNLKDVLPPVPEMPQQTASGLGGTYQNVPGMPGMVSKTVRVGGSDKGAIIGAQGKQINKIRQESGAHCTIDTPPDADTALLTIRGSLLQVEVAEKMIQECLAYQVKQDTWDQKWEKKVAFEEIVVEVEKRYIASVIGKGGCNLRDMGDQSGCKVIFKSASEIDPSAPPDKQVCVIRGPPQQLPIAEQLVRARVAEVTAHINSKPAPAWEPPPPKKEPCEFHMKGFCGFGDKCKFEHVGPPGGLKQEVCKFYLDGWCGYGDQCRSAHPEPCKFFQSGWCGYGDECRSAHIKPQTPAAPEKKEVCSFFAEGFCGYGDECRYAHIKPEEKDEGNTQSNGGGANSSSNTDWGSNTDWNAQNHNRSNQGTNDTSQSQGGSYGSSNFSAPNQGGFSSNSSQGFGNAGWNAAGQSQGNSANNAADAQGSASMHGAQGVQSGAYGNFDQAYGGATWNAPSQGSVAWNASVGGSGVQGMAGMQGMAPQMAPPQMAPPQMAPPQMTPPQMTPPQMTPPQMTPPQMTPPQMTPPQMTPAQMMPPQMASQMTPPQMQSPQMAGQAFQPGWGTQQSGEAMGAAGWTAPSMSAPNAWAGGCPGGWN